MGPLGVPDSGEMFLQAKKRGMAGMDEHTTLELCVKYPVDAVESLLRFCEVGARAEEWDVLGKRLEACRDEKGAATASGILDVYNRILESPGGISCAILLGLQDPSCMGSASWRQKYLQQVEGFAPSAPAHIAKQQVQGQRDAERSSHTQQLSQEHVPPPHHAQQNVAEGGGAPQANRVAPPPSEHHLQQYVQQYVQQHTVQCQKAKQPQQQLKSQQPPSNPTLMTIGVEGVRSHELERRIAHAKEADPALRSSLEGDAQMKQRESTPKVHSTPQNSTPKKALGALDTLLQAPEMRLKPSVLPVRTGIRDIVTPKHTRKEVEENELVSKARAKWEQIAKGKPSITREDFKRLVALWLGEGDEEDDVIEDMMSESEACKGRKTFSIKEFEAFLYEQERDMLQMAGQNSDSMLVVQPQGVQLEGKVATKREVGKDSQTKKYFLIMESSPGVKDVYVPRNIFTGYDLTEYHNIKAGDVLIVKAVPKVQGTNKWCATTFLEHLPKTARPAHKDTATNGSANARNAERPMTLVTSAPPHAIQHSTIASPPPHTHKHTSDISGTVAVEERSNTHPPTHTPTHTHTHAPSPPVSNPARAPSQIPEVSVQNPTPQEVASPSSSSSSSASTHTHHLVPAADRKSVTPTSTDVQGKRTRSSMDVLRSVLKKRAQGKEILPAKKTEVSCHRKPSGCVGGARLVSSKSENSVNVAIRKRRRKDEKNECSDLIESRVVNDRSTGWGDETVKESIILQVMSSGGKDELIRAKKLAASQKHDEPNNQHEACAGALGVAGAVAMAVGDDDGGPTRSARNASTNSKKKGRKQPAAGYTCQYCKQPGGVEGAHWSQDCERRDEHAAASGQKRKRPDCTFWIQGKCHKGADCTFSHDCAQDGAAATMCRFHLRGECSKGDSCPFSHDLKKWPCKFFHVGKRCAKGEECNFSHAALTQKQKEWVEREWEVNSKERREEMAKAMQTEREADARVARGEETRVELTQGELGYDEEDSFWFDMPIENSSCKFMPAGEGGGGVEGVEAPSGGEGDAPGTPDMTIDDDDEPEAGPKPFSM